MTKSPRMRLIGGHWYAWTTVRVGKLSQRVRETSGFREKDRASAEIWFQSRIAQIEHQLMVEQGLEPLDRDENELQRIVAHEVDKLAWNLRARVEQIEELATSVQAIVAQQLGDFRREFREHLEKIDARLGERAAAPNGVEGLKNLLQQRELEKRGRKPM